MDCPAIPFIPNDMVMAVDNVPIVNNGSDGGAVLLVPASIAVAVLSQGGYMDGVDSRGNGCVYSHR